jgi:hypothetical protein
MIHLAKTMGRGNWSTRCEHFHKKAVRNFSCSTIRYMFPAPVVLLGMQYMKIPLASQKITIIIFCALVNMEFLQCQHITVLPLGRLNNGIHISSIVMSMGMKASLLAWHMLRTSAFLVLGKCPWYPFGCNCNDFEVLKQNCPHRVHRYTS